MRDTVIWASYIPRERHIYSHICSFCEGKTQQDIAHTTLQICVPCDKNTKVAHVNNFRSVLENPFLNHIFSSSCSHMLYHGSKNPLYELVYHVIWHLCSRSMFTHICVTWIQMAFFIQSSSLVFYLPRLSLACWKPVRVLF